MEQGAVWCQRERVAGQVGPGGRGGDPPTVGKLQNEPWGVLPPEVVHRGSEGATDFILMTLEDTNPNPTQV